ncbi:hypothetical protein KJ877_00725 [bacterium]|nr:hypothetical protein [bacterium]MBU1989551.1 hypothetical protein [bacterium]
MVKKVLFFLLLSSFVFLFSDETAQEDILTQKIKTFIDANVYEQNKAYIDIIFSPRSEYLNGERVDAVKVIQTLKDNGLLNLFFKYPSELTLNFKTSGAPLFFVKLLGDSLRNIGYYRYVTKASNLDSSEFTWTISLLSEYATDPLILQKELQKSGCNIVDVQRNSSANWTYVVDMTDGHLNIQSLQNGEEVELKRSLYAHWLNVSNIKTLKIKSSRRNDWYPYIAYYDSSLHLLQVIKKENKMGRITLRIPKYAKYIKISDVYTLKNIRDALVLNPSGSR